MLNNDPVAVRQAILAGTIQQIQVESRPPSRTNSVRGSLASHGSSSAAVHRRVY